MNIFGFNTKKNKPLDFVAIGDMVIDAFIRLNEDSHARATEKGDGTKEITLPFGDKIPFEFAEEVVAVGNSANAAVAAARLGLSSGLIVNIGDDENGQKCLTQLKREGISTEFVKIHPGKKTNYHYVLWYKDERTILIKHEIFDYTLPLGSEVKKNTDPHAPRAIYLSSVSENALPYHDTLADYLDANPQIEFIFQPGTFQMKWGTMALTRIYKRANIFFCNYEEAERILNLSPMPKTPENVKSLLLKLRELGPTLPVITDGPHGAYTFNNPQSTNPAENSQVVHMPVYPDIAPPYERTGAGDAFASTFSIAYLQGKSIVDSLRYASINSMNVCQHVGAQAGLLHASEVEKYLASAPAEWQAKIVA